MPKILGRERPLGRSSSRQIFETTWRPALYGILELEEICTARQPIFPDFAERLIARQVTSYFRPVSNDAAKSGGTKISSWEARMNAKELPSWRSNWPDIVSQRPGDVTP